MTATTETSSKTPTPQKHVRVGVGVMVQDPSQPSNVFCGIRKGSHGAGTLALPGGHLEMYESWAECAVREVLEEMNLSLDVNTMKVGHVTNDPMPDEGKHYVTIFMLSRVAPQTPPQVPQNMEPHKCEGWKSYAWGELQQLLSQDQDKLFGPLRRLVNDNPPSVGVFLSKTTTAEK